MHSGFCVAGVPIRLPVAYAPAMSDEVERFVAHGRSLQEKYLQLRLSEADTRSYLIDPVLRLLGYSGVDDLRREVAIPATKEFVDYELLLDGEPQTLVEAKALRQRITDQHAAQCVQYASVLGVRWCFITNGVEWLLYDAHAKGPLTEKRVAAVRLDGDDESLTRAWEMLSLFGREALERPNPIASLLIGRVVADDLSDPDSSAIGALRRAVRARFGERVTSASIVAAVEKLTHVFPTISQPQEEVAAAAETKRRASRSQPSERQPARSSPGRRRVTLADLVEAGLLPDGAPIEADVKGVTHAARIRDGRIELSGEMYDSPSAASMALRNTQSWNGWVDWSYKGEKLADLRGRLPADEDASEGQGSA